MAEESHEVWARRKAAWEALIAFEKQDEELYEQGPIAKVLAKDSDGKRLVADEDIPGLFFHDGPASAAHILTYIRIDGDPLPLEDFGASLMMQAAKKEDGGLDLAKVDAWTFRYRVALSVLPGLQNKIAELREAYANVERAVYRKEKAHQDFLDSPAGLFIKYEPIIAAGKIFEYANPAAAMQFLIDTMNGDEPALASLKANVIDFLSSKLDLTEEGEAALVNIAEHHSRALALIFNDEDMRVFTNVIEDVKRSMISRTTSPSIASPKGPAIAERNGRLPTMISKTTSPLIANPKGLAITERNGRLPTSLKKRGWKLWFVK